MVAGVAGDAPRPDDYECDFPQYEALSNEQRSLIRVVNYDQLDTFQKASFLNITAALARTGVSLEGVSLRTVEQDRLTFTPGSAEILRERFGSNPNFGYSKPRSGEHPGMSDWGVRQGVRRYSLQAGVGPAGVFVDIDLWNPNEGFTGAFGHGREVGFNLITGRKTNPIDVGMGLAGRDVVGYSCNERD